MKTNIIVQAREGSTRFPLKVLQKINNKTILQILYERLCFSKKTDKIIFAIPSKNNNQLITHLDELEYDYFLGDETNVLSRYYKASIKFPSDIIVRITADCPLIDPNMLDQMIDLFISSKSDYTCNTLPPTFPDGLDIEIFNFKSLKKSYKEATISSDLEHVTSYIKNNSFFKKTNFRSDRDYSDFRITLDEKDDLLVISNIVNYYKSKKLFLWDDIKNLIQNKPDLFMANSKIKRNIGAKIGTGQKLWKRAKRIIPGGNMLLSKRPEMFLPENWPSYFSKAKGCKVWDLDNKQYYDMSMMGIGTNTLGYGHPEVDKAVMEIVNKGNMSTLNCPEEVFLAEKLVELHPWSEMVRFARTGAEANSIAIRIARAATQKDNVAVCGYHGWHDWYLSANIGNNKSLNSHLLPGLSSAGVPKNLKDTTFTFEYNDFTQLKKIVDEKNIGIIKMEVTRNFEPKDNFLLKVRELANQKNIVLIFDECSTGFRQAYGGIHKIFNVEPDLAMFGKTLGNGYAITAVIGKREIMEHAQNTFISSTFWTERIGPTAALKTLEIMKNIKSWETVTNIGLKIKDGWLNLAKKYNLKISTSGIPAFINFKIKSKDWLKYKTYLTQEMLKKSFLAGNSVYACIEHKDEVIEQYFQNLDPIFKKISEFEDGEQVDKYLEGPVSHTGFKRLN